MSHSCAHLHVHSEYSLLDGAGKDRQPRGARCVLRTAGAGTDRPRCDERRGRALPGVQEARDQADSGLRGIRHGRPHQARQAPPPDADRRERGRLPQPRQAVLVRFPRGTPARQADRRRRPDVPVLGGRDRADRLPRLALLPGARGRSRAGSAGGRRRAAADLRAAERVLRGPAERHRRPGEGQCGHRPDRARAGASAGRHR